jgi:mannose-6-phosphate isomerase-like protein (cupin superfamily)
MSETGPAAAQSPPAGWLAKLDEAIERIAARGGKPKPFEVMLAHGSARVGVYAPRGTDPQMPHDQDEVYIVARGTERRQFGPGDMLFVPAGVPHRFESFSGDFAVWVIFYGPAGGESAG